MTGSHPTTVPTRVLLGLVIAVLVLISACGIYFFVQRGEILAGMISRTIKKQHETNNLDIHIGRSRFTGLSIVELSDVTIVPAGMDTLMKLSRLEVGVKLWPLITGKVKLSELNLNSGWIHLVKKGSKRNYDFLFKKKDSSSSGRKNLGEIIENLINGALYKIPDHMNVRQLNIAKVDRDSSFSVLIRAARIEKKRLTSTFRYSDVRDDWHLQGPVDPGSHQLSLRFFSARNKVQIPYLQKKYGFRLSADTISTALKGVDYSGGRLVIDGSWGVRNLTINHPRIASNDITIPMGSIDARIVVGNDFVMLDSSSTIHLKELNAHPFLRYKIRKPRTYALTLATENTTAQKFFDSFPQGAFESMEGIKVGGSLSYRVDFYLDERDPDDLRFSAGFHKTNFRVLKYGAENLSKINGSFLYTPYEHGHPMRPRMIGPSNSNYAASAQISPYLRSAVVASEDPNFYSHQGIDEYAFRKVMVIDYKAKSFKRGGSTISMQLVKNVFLSREKTVSRKVEEMLITWMLENAGIASKQRILETYLNLIEWAPNIYGVGEASRFYFAKAPAGLTLGESIFLTSIIPKPKAYQYSFNPDGSLKNHLKGYYRFISGNLLARGKINPADTFSMFNIRLAGTAARYVIKSAPVQVDSSADSTRGNFFDRLINSFKSKDEHEAMVGSGPSVPLAASTSDRASAQDKRRAERKKKHKGKFMGIF